MPFDPFKFISMIGEGKEISDRELPDIQTKYKGRN